MDDAPSSRLRAEAPPTRPRIAALAEAPQRRPIVVLLGMHRSGTSLCSNVLSVLGVDMADDNTPGKGNDRGHWERWEIVGLHDRILDLFSRAYLGPLHDFPLPAGWWAEPRVAQIREEIVAFLKGRMGDAPFGFKDPRTVRLLPMWRQIFAELKLSPRFIFCLRNPAQAARSLHERDGLDPLIGEYRWLVHVADFFRYIGNSEFSVIEYDKWFQNQDENLDILQSSLNLEPVYGRTEIEQALADIIDPELRHDGPTAREANDPFIRHVYRLARSVARDPAARSQIQELVAQFVGFDRLHRPFHREFESLSALAARLPALEGEVGNLRASSTEATEALEAANARAAETDDALAQARAEIDEARARLSELEGEREAAASRAAGAEQATVAARAELDAAHARLTEIETERDAAVARATGAEQGFAEARVEIDAAHARLVEIEADREAAASRAGTAEVALVQAHSEIEAALARLAEVETERDAAAETALLDARAQIGTAHARVFEVEAARDAAVASLELAHAEANEARGKAEELGRDLADANRQLALREGDLFELLQTSSETEAQREADAARYDQDIAALRREAAEARTLADERLADRDALRRDLDAAAAHTQQLDREHAAETDELRRQLGTMSQELTAARQVSAAMMAALREPLVSVTLPARESRFALFLHRIGLRPARSAV